MNVLEQARAQLDGCIAERARLGESLRRSGITDSEHRGICDRYVSLGTDFVSLGVVDQVVKNLPSFLGKNDCFERMDRELVPWARSVRARQIPVALPIDPAERTLDRIYAWGFANRVMDYVAGVLGLDVLSQAEESQDARYLLMQALQPIGRQRAKALFSC